MRPEIPDALRRQVGSRAGFCCEYCLFPEQYATFRHQIDHIISVQHDGQSILDSWLMRAFTAFGSKDLILRRWTIEDNFRGCLILATRTGMITFG